MYRNRSSKRPCSCKRPGVSFDVKSLNAPPFHVQKHEIYGQLEVVHNVLVPRIYSICSRIDN